ncbi:MAG: DUF4830 domain-containing protein [Acutalibacteraceae bacterium]
MFVYSVKSSKIKVVLLIALCTLATIAFLLASSMDNKAANKGGINLKAGNSEQRVAFLSQFGWEFDKDPTEVSEVIIPAEFDQTYEKYNKIQKEQGFDLEPYKGIRVKRWTYEIKNYPGYGSDSGCIRANILVYDGLVIGGDVCSVELDGFMHGFDKSQEDSGEKATEKEKSQPSTISQKA